MIDRDHFFRFISSYICQISETLFEQHAHTLISNGGSFKIRNLKTNEESRLQLPIDLNLHLYSSNDLEFQSATNKYFRPVNKIFKSVDSFIKPNLLFEMTISKDHQCSHTGLCDVLETLGNPLNPELYCRIVSFHHSPTKITWKKKVMFYPKKLLLEAFRSCPSLF